MTKNTANGQYRLGTGPAKIALYGFVGNSRIRNVSICRRALSDTVVEPNHRLIRPHIAFADKTLRADLEEQSRGTAKAQKSYMKAATQSCPVSCRQTALHRRCTLAGQPDHGRMNLSSTRTTLPCRSEQPC